MPTASASADTYGLSQATPILVGTGTPEGALQGPRRERAYLERLRGPGGERVTFTREGSCCAFQTPNGVMGGGMLDRYEVTYPGLPRPVVLYINMYDAPGGPQRAPRGFTLAP